MVHPTSPRVYLKKQIYNTKTLRQRCEEGVSQNSMYLIIIWNWSPCAETTLHGAVDMALKGGFHHRAEGEMQRGTATWEQLWHVKPAASWLVSEKGADMVDLLGRKSCWLTPSEREATRLESNSLPIIGIIVLLR